MFVIRARTVIVVGIMAALTGNSADAQTVGKRDDGYRGSSKCRRGRFGRVYSGGGGGLQARCHGQ